MRRPPSSTEFGAGWAPTFRLYAIVIACAILVALIATVAGPWDPQWAGAAPLLALVTVLAGRLIAGRVEAYLKREPAKPSQTITHSNVTGHPTFVAGSIGYRLAIGSNFAAAAVCAVVVTASDQAPGSVTTLNSAALVLHVRS